MHNAHASELVVGTERENYRGFFAFIQFNSLQFCYCLLLETFRFNNRVESALHKKKRGLNIIIKLQRNGV